jgi:hypothetical protein
MLYSKAVIEMDTTFVEERNACKCEYLDLFSSSVEMG